MTTAAVFFPVDPEQSPFDLIDAAREGLGNGLRLYTNGRQNALLPKPQKGWTLLGLATPETPGTKAAKEAACN